MQLATGVPRREAGGEVQSKGQCTPPIGIRVSCSLLVKGPSSPNLDPSLRYAPPSRTAVLTLPEAPSGPKDTHTHTRACPKPDPHAHHNTKESMLAIVFVALWPMALEAGQGE